MFKDYRNIKDTKELEAHLIEVLNDDRLNKEQRAELNALLKEVQKINYIKWLKKELFNK